MKWRWIAAGAGLALLLRSSSRGRRTDAPELRRQFARIARMRLVAACPGLDGRVRERSLRETFDWIAAEMCSRTGNCDMAALTQWAIREGQESRNAISTEVTRDAVERLPAPVLRAIDGCQGRLFASVLLHESLTEAGRRALPELQRYAASGKTPEPALRQPVG